MTKVTVLLGEPTAIIANRIEDEIVFVNQGAGALDAADPRRGGP